MSPPPESDTELSLALPGDSRVSPEINRGKISGSKRGFLETVDLSLGSSGGENKEDKMPENEISSAAKPPAPKAQVVGWPPVRGRGIKKEPEKCKYVKVAVDGAPYLRKVDLDKDGDWMMLGDVPWKMFVESCKRLRLMKSSEAAGLGGRTCSTCSS
ncbi:Auxin-responsive protein IAA17 [Euphorbia peplus]|nr:Auxin-responsive protein IAA17 [Euphorbia peplus]